MAQTLTQVREWNAALKSARPETVALFVGGTSGIGKHTAIKLAGAVKTPTIYIVGRNEAAGAQVLEAMRKANPNGSYGFKAVDVSDLCSVDEACKELKTHFEALDLLFLSPGALAFSKNETAAGIDVNHMLRYYSRMRFIENLLPALEAAKYPRVISILAGGKEVMIEEDNLDLRKQFSLSASNGYPASMTSLAFEVLASQHPSVSFLHVFPGIVATPLMKRSMGSVAGTILGFLTKPISISAEESGEWQTWLSTSPNFAPKNSGQGAYILNYNGKDATNQSLMVQLREKGLPEIVWKHTQDTFSRILT
ncbi:short-chain dehydrogenases/reductase [Aspergillus eucalypticola CBS 122712]|uniref:Short-chain dehydrogenases/reductase n=1 Tax=Aspergillus eucalypticola (strain CBS 122712 / IBT 29274) TaxID=1448314 RepID=A0A317VXH8_ASPEC|nr:short-chain dehydrogenases/reductase [Aspergillus eucalypticola CBS 122712]PWY78973.1 short-chain dehydrogenases/reductase [Aspergillus eucalypticola CBS 122712]